MRPSRGSTRSGYVVPNRAIGAALWDGLSRQPAVRTIAPARVVGSDLGDGCRNVHFELDGQSRSLSARLVVAADGIRSVIRDQSGIGADHIEYEQTAITAVLVAQRFHDHVAYERFTEEGPIAMLPLTDGRCGMVWTRKPAAAARLLALSDEDFLREFQAAFGFRLGRFLRVGQRTAYDLTLSRAASHTAPRIAVVGGGCAGSASDCGPGIQPRPA